MPSITKLSIGAFCKELVLQLEPLPKLLTSWNLTQAEYDELRKSEFFQNELILAVNEVKAMGPDAGFIARCKILAEDALESMVGIMDNTTTPPDVKVRLFDTFTELARLKPQKQAAVADNASARGPQVVFNFGAGMPGLPTSVTLIPEPAGPTLIEATPTNG